MHETILTAIIALAPSSSPYSVVAMPECGAPPMTAESPSACAGASWSPFYGAHVRPETPAEARSRLEVIARALEAVSLEATTAEPGERPLWPWPRRELVAGLLTIARHESAFRRDVHEGVGPAALGDCSTGRDGVRRCRSVCLVQVQTGGLDVDSTARCLRAGAELLARSRWSCARGGGAWFAPSVALYGSGVSCGTRRPWVQRRAETYRRVIAAL